MGEGQLVEAVLLPMEDVGQCIARREAGHRRKLGVHRAARVDEASVDLVPAFTRGGMPHVRCTQLRAGCARVACLP